MARPKKWIKGEHSQVKVRVDNKIYKKYKGWLDLKELTAQDHLEEEIKKVAN